MLHARWCLQLMGAGGGHNLPTVGRYSFWVPCSVIRSMWWLPLDTLLSNGHNFPSFGPLEAGRYRANPKDLRVLINFWHKVLLPAKNNNAKKN